MSSEETELEQLRAEVERLGGEVAGLTQDAESAFDRGTRTAHHRAEAAESEMERLRRLCIPITDLVQELDLARQNLHHARAMSDAHFARAEAAEAKVARVEETIQREGKLHSTWDKRSEMVVPVDALRAALADAPGDRAAWQEPTP
jgi:chromosome segregation ATPase